jgi:RNA polymerase sigma factor (sigma-70 family)
MHSNTDYTRFHAFPQDVRTRASLLQRVRDWSDDASWREFFATYSKLIYSMALKAGLTHTESEDVVQGTMAGVAGAIRDFQYNRDGSFKQWIGNHAMWRIQDQLRRPRREVELGRDNNDAANRDRTKTAHRIPDERDQLELFVERDWNEAVGAMAWARVRSKVKPKHFQMFDLYAVKQWPLRRISRTLGVNVAQVYLVKSRIALMLKQETNQVKKQLERLPPINSFQPNQNKTNDPYEHVNSSDTI